MLKYVVSTQAQCPDENCKTMHVIPVGLSWSWTEGISYVLEPFYFLLLFKFVKLKTFCSFQVENGLVFRVCLPDTSATHLLGYCSPWFQSNPGGRCLSSNLYIEFPPLFSSFHSKAGTEIAFQNIEILRETNWPFSTLVRNTRAGRVGSKKTLQG